MSTEEKSGWFRPTTLLDKLFEFSLLIKAVTATLEVIGAILLMVVPSQAAVDFVHHITQRELYENHHSAIAHTVTEWVNSLWLTSHGFAITFLLVHAAIKYTIVFGLLRNKRWAYPFGFSTLILMMAYQLYDIVVHFSWGMVVLFVFDIFVLWLVWREYQKLPEHLKFMTSTQRQSSPAN